MRCLGNFVISLYVFKLYKKHFIINHCLTLELITKGCWAIFKNSFKEDISLECFVCVCGGSGHWGGGHYVALNSLKLTSQGPFCKQYYFLLS